MKKSMPKEWVLNIFTIYLQINQKIILNFSSKTTKTQSITQSLENIIITFLGKQRQFQSPSTALGLFLFDSWSLIKTIYSCMWIIIGGERGIRTLETVSRLHAFQACAFNHSATSPIYNHRSLLQILRGTLYLWEVYSSSYLFEFFYNSF